MIFAAPGVLLVWSGDRPRCHAAAIPPDGLTLGRDLLDKLLGTVDDDRISRQHTQLMAGTHSVAIRDLVSRNGTFIDGQPLFNSAELPFRGDPFTVIRTGRSVWLLVPDVTRYERITLSRRGRLVVGTSLAETCAAVEVAALDRVHLMLEGSITVGRELARSYATAIGGKAARFDLEAKLRLSEVLAHAKPQTLVLEVTRPFPKADLRLLETVLDGDLRIVTLINEQRWLSALPLLVRQRLAQRQRTLPEKRYDELSTTVFDLIRDVTPAATVHATVIERCMVGIRDSDEDSLLVQLRESLLRWRVRPTEALRGDHLTLSNPDRVDPCLVALPRPIPVDLGTKSRTPLHALPSRPPSDASWHNRRLCADGDCYGVIAADGRCKVCGRLEPLGDPYR